MRLAAADSAPLELNLVDERADITKTGPGEQVRLPSIVESAHIHRLP